MNHGELTGWLPCCEAGAACHLGAVSGLALLLASPPWLLGVLVDANSSGAPDMKIYQNMYARLQYQLLDIAELSRFLCAHFVPKSPGKMSCTSKQLCILQPSSCHHHFYHLASVTTTIRRVRRTSWLFIAVP